MANTKTGKSLKDVSFKRMPKDLKTPALIVVGLAGAAFGAKQIIKAINKNKQVSGLLGINKDKLKLFVVPGASIITGLTAYQLAKSTHWKAVASGVVAHGVLTSVNQLLNQNVMNGLGEFEESQQEQGNNTNTQAIPQASELKLDVPLYELDEPVNRTSSYIDAMMQDIETPSPAYPTMVDRVPKIETVQETEPETENRKVEDVNLQSNRPEDNYETKKTVDESPEESVSGNLDAIIIPRETVEEPMYYQREYTEELDFSNIP